MRLDDAEELVGAPVDEDLKQLVVDVAREARRPPGSRCGRGGDGLAEALHLARAVAAEVREGGIEGADPDLRSDATLALKLRNVRLFKLGAAHTFGQSGAFRSGNEFSGKIIEIERGTLYVSFIRVPSPPVQAVLLSLSMISY